MICRHTYTTLFRGGGAALGDYRCAAGRDDPSPEEAVRACVIAFVRRGVFEKQVGTRRALATSAHVVFYAPGEPYRTHRAYLEKDRQTIRRTHTDDWRGFTVGADALLRGLDAYMSYADRHLADSTPAGYEILDSEVRVYGDVAVVYYLARYEYVHDGEARALRLRAVDVYERRGGHWIQSGSNICTVPDEGL